jgi:hypothetical protein
MARESVGVWSERAHTVMPPSQRLCLSPARPRLMRFITSFHFDKAI